MQPLLTAKQVAGLLQLSERTVFTLTKTQQLIAVRMGSSVRYAPEDVQSFINRQRLQACSTSDTVGSN